MTQSRVETESTMETNKTTLTTGDGGSLYPDGNDATVTFDTDWMDRGLGRDDYDGAAYDTTIRSAGRIVQFVNEVDGHEFIMTTCHTAPVGDVRANLINGSVGLSIGHHTFWFPVGRSNTVIAAIATAIAAGDINDKV
jgi:hypothetical protein